MLSSLAGSGDRDAGGDFATSPPQVNDGPADLADRIGPVDLTKAPPSLAIACENGVGALAFQMPCLVGMNLPGQGGVGTHVTECRMVQAGTPVAWSFLLPLGELAACLGEANEIEKGLAAVDEALARCKARHEQWYVPELLRMKGDLLLRQNAAVAAEDHFIQATRLATLQDARSWQLRISMSHARLLGGLGRQAEARSLLGQVHAWFSEGFTTADLRRASDLLAEL